MKIVNLECEGSSMMRKPSKTPLPNILKTGQERRCIEIVSYASGKVVKRIDVTGKSERQVDRIDNGINRNLDHERFYTIIP